MKKNQVLHTLLLLLCFCLAGAFSVSAAASSDERWECSMERDEDNNILMVFEEVQVLLPEDWGGKVQMSYSTNGVSFYHIDSRNGLTEELGYANGGHLFSICFTDSDDYTDLPDYIVIGTVADGTYYAEFPTDVQAYTGDLSVYTEYFTLNSEIEWVKANMTLITDSIVAVDSSYLFPTDSTVYMTEESLAGMTAEEVQLGINEIYARHHRRFLDEEVQADFDSRLWYSGFIEAADFDETVLNSCEVYNIAVMQNYIDNYSENEDSEYILPTSSTAYLTASDLEGMTADELQMAINEIYARHGRRFNTESIQAYFNSKSWYTGTIDPDNFSTSVLNAYEVANIELLVQTKNARS